MATTRKKMRQTKSNEQKIFFLFLIVIVIGGSVLFYKERQELKVLAHTAMTEIKSKKTKTIKKKETIRKKESKQDKRLRTLPKQSKASDWNLRLVNKDHAIQKEPENLGTFQGFLVDERIIPHLNEMEAAAKKEGIQLLMISSFRSIDYQRQLFQQSIDEGKANGLTEKQAKTEALRYRTEPGTSEHHTGLAFDMIDTDWQHKSGELIAEYGQEKGGKWLQEHGCEYGFVVRYPEHKQKQTAIEYEPWHMRYVGKENALFMKEHDLCLEEYVSLLNKR